MVRSYTAQEFSPLVSVLPAIVFFLLLYQSSNNFIRKAFVLITCPKRSTSLSEAEARTPMEQAS